MRLSFYPDCPTGAELHLTPETEAERLRLRTLFDDVVSYAPDGTVVLRRDVEGFGVEYLLGKEHP